MNILLTELQHSEQIVCDFDTVFVLFPSHSSEFTTAVDTVAINFQKEILKLELKKLSVCSYI